MEEKIYYQDSSVKVTNLRITCNHVTIMVSKIDHVYIDFKVVSLLASGFGFFLSLVATLFGCIFAPHILNGWGYLGIVPITLALVWYRMTYRTYTELKIVTGNKVFKILEDSMTNREYVYKIEECLKSAMIDHHQRKEIIAADDLTPSETVMLKKIVLEYDQNRSSK